MNHDPVYLIHSKKLNDEQCRGDKYWCDTCGGWILTKPKSRSYDDIQCLTGSVGIELVCHNCNNVIGRVPLILS